MRVRGAVGDRADLGQVDTGAACAEWPRERLRRSGVEALSSAELMALVLRTGHGARSAMEVAAGLLRRFGSLPQLARAGDAEIEQVAGVGPAKLASLRAALELGVRSVGPAIPLGESVTGPERVAAYLAPRMRHLRQERFLALLLDSRRRLLREVEVSRGSLDQSLVHPREVFGPALREAAAAVVVVHNHPSGDPEPSREDREVTCRLVRAGDLLGIPVVDHVVIASHGYTSFARRGWLDAQVGSGERR